MQYILASNVHPILTSWQVQYVAVTNGLHITIVRRVIYTMRAMIMLCLIQYLQSNHALPCIAYKTLKFQTKYTSLTAIQNSKNAAYRYFKRR